MTNEPKIKELVEPMVYADALKYIENHKEYKLPNLGEAIRMGLPTYILLECGHVYSGGCRVTTSPLFKHKIVVISNYHDLVLGVAKVYYVSYNGLIRLKNRTYTKDSIMDAIRFVDVDANVEWLGKIQKLIKVINSEDVIKFVSSKEIITTIK